MKIDRRAILVMLAPGLAVGAWLVLGGILLWATFDPAQRGAIAGVLGPLVQSHGMIVVLWWLVAAALGAWTATRLLDRHVSAAERLAASTRVLTGDASAPDPAPSGSAAVRALTGAISGLAGQRRSLQEDMDRLVEEASRRVAEQRDRLAALMAELEQSVVVCNLDGRILLYNERARRSFRTFAHAPGGAAGADVIGLGRSIHDIIDPALIAHALETVEQRIAGGGDAASVPARFVTSTSAGYLLRVNLAPVRSEASATGALTGFVLLLDDITADYEADTRRDREVLDLIEANRASLANAQAALDLLDYPDLDAEGRDRFQAVVRDEVAAMGARITAFAAATSQDMMTRWPLQDMLGMDLLAAAQRRIEAEHGRRPMLDAADPTLWLSVDSFALIEALAFLAGRLVAAFGQPDLQLRLTRAGSHARLDLAWSGPDAVPETASAWQIEPMQAGSGRSPLSVRDIAERHGGEIWIEHDRERGCTLFRFLLPIATAEPTTPPIVAGPRPEYYDFDLFARGTTSRALEERLLSDLAYTVFDTETTGLDPAEGDEILQIGAARIVNGRLLRGECFDQLVDPGRSIPEASTRIHGIRPEHVRGKPSIVEILPAFHAFVSDTVLVGHNVAFDMRFLKLKEAASGVRFDQPVLDTLLLSSVVHPEEATHSLEATSGRLGLKTAGRHSALGDALSTAEVFLKLLPLLRQRGILTLAQAREASQNSYYARLRY